MSMASIKNALAGLKSLAIGLGITGRAFCAKKVTVIYPKEEVDNLSTYRGHVELVGKEAAPGEPKCIACGLCAKACPSNCFTILCPVPAKEGESCNPGGDGPSPTKGRQGSSRVHSGFFALQPVRSMCQGLCDQWSSIFE